MKNLNNYGYLDIEKMEFGKTQNIEVKVGRSLYYVDVDKNRETAFVDFYPKTAKKRNEQSKYGNSGTLGVIVKPNAALGRDFFENIEQIKAAQDVLSKWTQVVK